MSRRTIATEGGVDDAGVFRCGQADLPAVAQRIDDELLIGPAALSGRKDDVDVCLGMPGLNSRTDEPKGEGRELRRRAKVVQDAAHRRVGRRYGMPNFGAEQPPLHVPLIRREPQRHPAGTIFIAESTRVRGFHRRTAFCWGAMRRIRAHAASRGGFDGATNCGSKIGVAEQAVPERAQRLVAREYSLIEQVRAFDLPQIVEDATAQFEPFTVGQFDGSGVIVEVRR